MVETTHLLKLPQKFDNRTLRCYRTPLITHLGSQCFDNIQCLFFLVPKISRVFINIEYDLKRDKVRTREKDKEKTIPVRVITILTSLCEKFPEWRKKKKTKQKKKFKVSSLFRRDNFSRMIPKLVTITKIMSTSRRKNTYALFKKMMWKERETSTH